MKKSLSLAQCANNVYYQQNPQLFKELLNLYNSAKSSGGFIQKLLSDGTRNGKIYDKNLDRSVLREWIDSSLQLLDDPIYTLSTKCTWIFTGRVDFPKCTNPACINYGTSNAFIGKNISLFEDYSRYCNRKCQNSHPQHKQSVEQTCVQRYGKKSTLSVKEFRDKGQQTLEKHYNVKNPGQLQSNHRLQLKKSYENFILTNRYDQPLFSLDEYLNRENDDIELLFRCSKCGYVFSAKHKNGNHHKCPKCYNYKYTSIQEKSLVDFLNSLTNITVQENIRSIIFPYELDIYIPEKHLAVEYDGLYWHSDEKKSKTYHLLKTEACEKHGIQLIHVFENEWLIKQDVVKSRLKNLLGIYDKTIYARKCVIKEVDSKTSKEFQEQNHIQGAVNASVNLGLFYDNELISIMTFSKTRFSKKYEWELVRFCNKLGYHVPGAAGKLLKHFEKTWNPKSLVSYADRRWSQGKVYKALGFTLDHISAPNYWYWKDVQRLESRIKFQKHRLMTLLDDFNPCQTEVQNMKNNGYHQIFDCGNLVFVK